MARHSTAQHNAAPRQPGQVVEERGLQFGRDVLSDLEAKGLCRRALERLGEIGSEIATSVARPRRTSTPLSQPRLAQRRVEARTGIAFALQRRVERANDAVEGIDRNDARAARGVNSVVRRAPE